jgi:phage gpG-like protein
VETSVDVRDVLSGLKALKDRAVDLRPVMMPALLELAEDVVTHFRRQEGPDGPWPARAASTVERGLQRRGFVRKRGARRGQLTRRGERWSQHLLGAFRGIGGYRAFAGPQDATIKAKGEWAGIHQFGGVAGRGSRIPARPFLWASDAVVERTAEALSKFLREAW